jgi:hypothetical protein
MQPALLPAESHAELILEQRHKYKRRGKREAAKTVPGRED